MHDHHSACMPVNHRMWECHVRAIKDERARCMKLHSSREWHIPKQDTVNERRAFIGGAIAAAEVMDEEGGFLLSHVDFTDNAALESLAVHARRASQLLMEGSPGAGGAVYAGVYNKNLLHFGFCFLWLRGGEGAVTDHWCCGCVLGTLR